jgi:hypothetical protein
MSFTPPRKYDLSKDNFDSYEEMKYEFVSSFWMDKWYSPEIEKLKITPKTILIPLEERNDLSLFFNGTNMEDVTYAGWKDQDTIFKDPKFLRLSSLSSKNKIPIYNLEDGIRELYNSSRIQESIKRANKYNEQLYLCIRDWIDISEGYEFRLFVFEDKLKAICSNDTKSCDLSDTDILNRALFIFEKIKSFSPMCDILVDIFLHEHDPKKDKLIEFNSYGLLGDGGSGLFDWNDDAHFLLSNVFDIPVQIKRYLEIL